VKAPGGAFQGVHGSWREWLTQDLANNRSNPKAVLILVMFRLAQRLRRQSGAGSVLALPYLVFYRVLVEWIFAVELPWNTQVGPGLRLFHAQALIVNDHSTIGSNCTLRNSTTLGHVSRDDGEVARVDGTFSRGPLLGDNVDVGANVVIVGEVRIGDGAIIGAGSVVVRDVPAGATVVGNPARVIRMADGSSPVTEGESAG
jgi:putative colanic acid biosynthesis acetyltransferase WcaB